MPVIKSDKENDFYKTLGNHVWLGIQLKNGSWLTDDGQVQSYFNWKSGHPRNPNTENYDQSLADCFKKIDRLNQSTCVEFYDGPLNSGHARLMKDSGEWDSESLAASDGKKRFYLTVCTYVCRELREYYDET